MLQYGFLQSGPVEHQLSGGEPEFEYGSNLLLLSRHTFGNKNMTVECGACTTPRTSLNSSVLMHAFTFKSVLHDCASTAAAGLDRPDFKPEDPWEEKEAGENGPLLFEGEFDQSCSLVDRLSLSRDAQCCQHCWVLPAWSAQQHRRWTASSCYACPAKRMLPTQKILCCCALLLQAHPLPLL